MIELVALLVILAIFLAAAWAIIRKAPRFGGVLVIVTALLLMGMVTLRVSDQTTMVGSREFSERHVSLASASSPEKQAWRAEVDETFLPDVYPSRESAVLGLGRQVKPLLLRAIRSQGIDPTALDDSITIILRAAEEHPADAQTLGALLYSLTQDFPNTTVLSPDSPAEQLSVDAKHFLVELSFKLRSETSQEEGEFVVTVHRHKGDSLVARIPFVNASWVYQDSEDDHFIRVLTAKFQSSREDSELALKDAVAAVLSERFHRFPDSDKVRPDFNEREKLREAPKDYIGLVAADFTQKLRMASGDSVYRSAARIDSSRLEPLFANIVANQRVPVLVKTQQRRSHLYGLIQLLLVVAVIFFSLKYVSQRVADSSTAASDSG